MPPTRKPTLASHGAPPAEKKKTIFDTIKAVSAVRPLTYADLQEQGLPYEPFLVNRAFSLSEDTVLAASLMNQRPHLDKAVQATFYIHSLRPRRRFEAWPKSLDVSEAQTIARYYGMSLREAKLLVNLHTKEQLSVMRTIVDDGGSPSRF